jgi:hypothetical protein
VTGRKTPKHTEVIPWASKIQIRTVPEIPPVESAESAMRVQIVRDLKKGKK